VAEIDLAVRISAVDCPPFFTDRIGSGLAYAAV
jgi:hypothetical protein